MLSVAEAGAVFSKLFEPAVEEASAAPAAAAPEPGSEELTAEELAALEAQENAEPGDETPPVEPETPPEAPAEGEEPPETEPAAPADHTTLKMVAEAVGVEEADLLSRVVVDGPDGKPIPLQAALEAFRKAPAAAQLHQELETRRVELEGERTRLTTEAEAAIQRSYEFTRAAAALLQHEESQIDWKTLEREDPQQYLIERRRRDERVAQFQRLWDGFGTEAQRGAQANGQARARFQNDELRALQTKVPELAKDDFRKGFFDDIRELLHSVGFKDEEIDPKVLPILDDHRVWLALHEGAKQHKLRKTGALKLTPLRKLPKPSVPSASRKEELSNVAKDAQRRNLLAARLRKTGDIRDAAAIFKELV